MPTPNGTKSAFGPVTREKYESLLLRRIRACKDSINTKLDEYRPTALEFYLLELGIFEDLQQYRRQCSILIDVVGEPYWPSNLYLKDDEALMNIEKVRAGVDRVMKNNPDIKPLFDELARLDKLADEVTEKVWLAGCPDDIAELINQIGQPS